MRRRMHRAAQVVHIVCASLLTAPGAFAARPMITDDARVVAPKSCQVESWMRRNPDSTEYWALPACNPTGNLELTFGGAMTRELGMTHTTDVQVQAKTIFKTLEPNGWGYGLVVGHLRRPGESGRSGSENLYGYVPASFSLANDTVVLHVNLGTLVPPGQDARRGNWGVGAEVKLFERLYFIPEVFNQAGGRPLFQTGLRFWVVPNRVQIDATYGDRVGGEGGVHWFSIGMRLLSPPVFP